MAYKETKMNSTFNFIWHRGHGKKNIAEVSRLLKFEFLGPDLTSLSLTNLILFSSDTTTIKDLIMAFQNFCSKNAD